MKITIYTILVTDVAKGDTEFYGCYADDEDVRRVLSDACASIDYVATGDVDSMCTRYKVDEEFGVYYWDVHESCVYV